MNLNPVIKSYLSKYKMENELTQLEDSELFERFVIENIAYFNIERSNQIDPYFINNVTVDGSNDGGIDGILIKIDGVYVTDLSEVEEILHSANREILAEFIFIQSKYKNKQNRNGFLVFANGIKEFFNTDTLEPFNDDVKRFLDIKERLLNDKDGTVFWRDNPSVKVYYATMGEDSTSDHLESSITTLKLDLEKLNFFSDISVNLIDSKKIQAMHMEKENKFNVKINIEDSFSLSNVNNVDESIIVLCKANELVSLMQNEEGLLRKTIYQNNVRDYQGDTLVNREIVDTIETSPQDFVLLNNGITIVCNSMSRVGKTITIETPQIVNGCQTSSTLFEMYKKNVNIDEITLIIKLVATKSNEVVNKVVRGTNKQNIVLNEVFEITSNFHKELEDFFECYLAGTNYEYEKVLYERRRHQFSGDSAVKNTQTVNMRNIIQTFTSLFLMEPNCGHLHESILLEKYENNVFVAKQSKLPYYLGGLMNVECERVFRKKDIMTRKKYYKFKFHIMYAMLIGLGGIVDDINDTKKIDKYCEAILDKIPNPANFLSHFNTAVNKFQHAVDLACKKEGTSYYHSIKTDKRFVNFLTTVIIPSYTDDVHKIQKYRGTVLSTRSDKNGKSYGFISRNNKENIFFHSKENPKLSFSNLLYKDVTYEIHFSGNGDEKAINVNIVS